MRLRSPNFIRWHSLAASKSSTEVQDTLSEKVVFASARKLDSLSKSLSGWFAEQKFFKKWSRTRKIAFGALKPLVNIPDGFRRRLVSFMSQLPSYFIVYYRFSVQNHDKIRNPASPDAERWPPYPQWPAPRCSDAWPSLRAGTACRTAHQSNGSDSSASHTRAHDRCRAWGVSV